MPHDKVSPKLTTLKILLRVLQTRGNNATLAALFSCRYYIILAERKGILFRMSLGRRISVSGYKYH